MADKKGSGDKIFDAKLKAIKETFDDKLSPMKGQRLSDKIFSEKKKYYEKKKYFKGGRAGYKNGSMCKLAIKGKGKAYGKNS
jgi:hypothetical protein